MRLYSIMMDFMTADTYLNLQFFVDKYQVSKRTIQNDISYLLRMSSRKGYQLRLQRGKGYLLEVTNQELLNDFIQILYQNKRHDAKNRIENILAYIAIQKEYISMDEIAIYFDISKTSVKNEMKEVEDMAKSYDVSLIKKSHYGICIDKTKRQYKEMLVEMVFNENPIIVKALQESLGDFEVIYKTLVNLFVDEKQNINYNELKNIYVWLQVATLHAYLTESISCEDTKDESTAISRMAWELKRWIETVYHVYIDCQSVYEIMDVIKKNVRIKDETLNLDERLESDIDDFLKEIDKVNKTDFRNDQRFKEMLLAHVSLLMSRIHQKISYKNALLNEICIKHPMIFNIAIEFSNMLKINYNVEVTHDEAAFIATHFAGHLEKEKKEKILRFNRVAIVCSSGGGSAFLLKLQMETIFVNKSVETFSFLQMKELEEYEPDIIFTIMPLEQDFNVPIIYVHELLDEEDLKRIRQFLEYDHIDSISLTKPSSKVESLFRKEYFQILQEDSYLKLIENMAQKIEDAKIGDDEYTKHVLERESYMSTIFLNGIAIPHPIKLCSRENLISVCILEKPIVEDQKEVKVVFMISLTKEDYYRYQDVTKLLYRLMNDDFSIQRICESKSFEQMLVILKELEGMIS